MPNSRDALKIEITERLGCFPAFLQVALEFPEVLEGLWRQMQSSYLQNPLPPFFKEKLALLLARESGPSYFLHFHCAQLHQLGWKGPEIFNLLEKPFASSAALVTPENEPLIRLSHFPEAGSPLEEFLLQCSLSIFVKDEPTLCRQKLRQVLDPAVDAPLMQLMTYLTSVFSWAELYPEISRENDPSLQKTLSKLLQEEPRFQKFLKSSKTASEENGLFWNSASEIQQQLAIERRKLVDLFAQAPVPLAIFEGPQHRFAFANTAYTDIFFGGKEVIGQTVVEVMPEVISQGFLALLDEVYATGKAYQGREVPVVLHQKNGQDKKFILNFVYHPTINARGEVEGILVVATDVTEQVQVRELIQQQEKWLRSILDRMPVGLVMLDPVSNKVTFSNKVAQQMIAGPLDHTIPGERYGQTVTAYDKSGRLLSAAEIPSARASRGEEMKEEEFVLQTPSGRYTIMVASEMIPSSFGHQATALLLLQDISATRAVEEEFRRFAELAPQMPFMADAKGAITYFSPRWYEYIGSVQGTEGWGWKDQGVHHPEDSLRAVEMWTESVRTGNPYEIEYRLRRHDGQYRWHLGRALAARDAAGNIVKWFGTNVDIHDQKILAERLSAAVQAADLGFWDWSMDADHVEWNEQLRQHYRFPEGQYDGTLDEVMARIHPEDRSLVTEALNESLARRSRYHLEFRVQDLDGTVRWLECEGQLHLGANGKAVRMTGTSLDVTERKRIQDLTLRTAAYFRSLTDSMPQIVWSARADGRINFANQRWVQYSGSSQPEDLLNFIHPEDQPKALRQWQESVRTGAPYETEFRLLRHKDHSYRWHLVRALVIENSMDAETRWFGTCTDVTDQKLLQEQLQTAKTQAEAASEIKSAFLANMSHEIRTPLGAILGFTELLKSAHLGGEARDFLDVIERNGRALTHVIDDILDLSKVESGKMNIEMVQFSLRELIKDVVTLFHDKTQAKGIDLAVIKPEEIPEQIVSDPARVRQILINLIGNAVKFTSEGGVVVSVEVKPGSQNRQTILVRIKDSGHGITLEQSEKLFQPFVQADNSTTRKFGGTGLGLALSRRLARAMGGDVFIESCEVNKGCVFVCELSAQILKTSSTFLTKDTGGKTHKSMTRLEGVRVLVVDDAPDNRSLMNFLLKREGAMVDQAADGAEAVKRAHEGDHDVVLMDIQMPLKDGYGALAELQALHYAKPVIALTAHAMLEERMRSLKAGFADHVTKPVNAEILVQTILEQLKKAPR